MRKVIKVEIRKSSIEGFGIFTKEDIKKGEPITLEKDPKIFPDGEPWRYVNHQCKNPNITVDERYTTRRFRATRDIQMGEELTINYQSWGWQYYFLEIMKKGCKCPDCVANKQKL